MSGHRHPRRARRVPRLAAGPDHPDQVGLPVYDAGKRRVPGLRREEVATLAGLAVEYYTQLERGKAGGVSESVLDAIARALQLDEAERTHLADLHRSAPPARSGPGHGPRGTTCARCCGGCSTP